MVGRRRPAVDGKYIVTARANSVVRNVVAIEAFLRIPGLERQIGLEPRIWNPSFEFQVQGSKSTVSDSRLVWNL